MRNPLSSTTIGPSLLLRVSSSCSFTWCTPGFLLTSPLSSMSPKVASDGALTSLWSLSSLSCHPVPPLTLSSPSLTSRKLFDTSWDEVTLVRLFVAGARPHVEASVPLLARHRIPGSLWLLSVNSLGRFEHCPRLGPLSAAVQPACSWAQKWRFTFGIGPTKSAVMVFGPRRHVHLRHKDPAEVLAGDRSDTVPHNTSVPRNMSNS